MADHVSFLSDLGIVLVVASVASIAFRLIRLPSLLGYLVAGLAIGPYIPIPIFADPGRVEALAEFGVVLVMFSVGLEFSLGRLTSVLPKAGFSAVVQMSGLALCGFVGGRAFGFTPTESLFLGASLSISSTMVVARVFDGQDVPQGLRDLVFGVLVVQDLVAVALITVLMAVATGAGVSGDEILGVVGSLVAVLVGMVVAGLLVVPRIVRLIVRLGSTEVTIVAALGLCFGFAILAQSFGYSVALGAFIAGMLVAESGRAQRIEVLVGPVRDLFAAVFFVSIGMLVDPLAALENMHIAIAIAVVVVAVQFATVTMASVLGGNGLRISVRAGIYLGQVGEFSFIMITIGTAAGVVDARLLSIVVTVAALTTFTTPMLGRVSGRLAEIIDGGLPRRIQTALSLYESWIEQLRRATATRRERSRGRRLGFVVGLDAAALVALTICTSLFGDDLAALASTHFGLAEPVSGRTVLAVAVGVAIPFAVTLFRSSKALAQLFARRIVPVGAEDAPDLGAAPRRLLTVAFQLILLVAIGAPFVAVTMPFVQSGVGLIGFALAVSVLVAFLWRDASSLQGHVRAGAEVLIDLLARQRENESEIEDMGVLPGLDGLHTVRIMPGTVGCATTLAKLNLRAVSGATVLAIRRGESGVVTPTGQEMLAAGDLLAVSGTEHAIELARRLLEREKSPERTREEDASDQSKTTRAGNRARGATHVASSNETPEP